MNADQRRRVSVIGLTWMPFVASWLAVAMASPAEESDRPQNPREMFRALDIDDSYFGRFVDGQAMDASENEAVWRIISRLRTFPLVDVERWALDANDLDEVVRRPELKRGEIFRLRGRVIQVEPVKLSGDAVQRYEFSQYYRCRLELDAPSQTVDVYTENVPAVWQNGASPAASGSALGVFLKFGAKADAGETPIFVAPRVAWYPDNILGELGMDFGLLDSSQALKPFNPKSPVDREAFYQMLDAVGRAEPGQLLRLAEEELPKTSQRWRTTDRQGQEQFSVVPLFNEPATQHGRLVELFGTARRVDEIHLDPTLDADVIARFGFDHYYEVYLFTDESQNNPLTFCLRELPKGMPVGKLPHYAETVRIAGFFFKTWNYGVVKLADPRLTPGDPKTHRQLSPMLIGRSLVWYPVPQPGENTFNGVLIGGLFILCIVVIWVMAWLNRRHEQKWLAEMETPPTFDLKEEEKEEE
jgi:hypothetical protein